MNLIKTCYGEWINPSLVKHFSVDYAEHNCIDFVDVRTDGVTIQTFKVEEPPRGDWWNKEDYQMTPEEKSALQAWCKAYNENKRKTRAEACAWLAKLVDDLKLSD